jgi:hypothetical protein
VAVTIDADLESISIEVGDAVEAGPKSVHPEPLAL